MERPQARTAAERSRCERAPTGAPLSAATAAKSPAWPRPGLPPSSARSRSTAAWLGPATGATPARPPFTPPGRVLPPEFDRGEAVPRLLPGSAPPLGPSPWQRQNAPPPPLPRPPAAPARAPPAHRLGPARHRPPAHLGTGARSPLRQPSCRDDLPRRRAAGPAVRLWRSGRSRATSPPLPAPPSAQRRPRSPRRARRGWAAPAGKRRSRRVPWPGLCRVVAFVGAPVPALAPQFVPAPSTAQGPPRLSSGTAAGRRPEPA